MHQPDDSGRHRLWGAHDASVTLVDPATADGHFVTLVDPAGRDPE